MKVKQRRKRQGRRKLTDGGGISNNHESNGAQLHLPPADPRILAFVRMIARKAAERDYARHIRQNGSTQINQTEEENP